MSKHHDVFGTDYFFKIFLCKLYYNVCLKSPRLIKEAHMKLQFFKKRSIYKYINTKRQDKRQPTTEKTYSHKDNRRIRLGESTSIQNITLYNTK